MRSWSFPLGKPFGVELRLHWMFLVFFFLACSAASADGFGAMRGFAFGLLLFLAVATREAARAIAAAVFHIELRSILLLPICGLQAPLHPETELDADNARARYTMALVGPISNLLTGAILAGLLLGAVPGVPLLAHPWINASSLLRTAVWLNVGLAALHCIPAFPLDAGRLLRDLSVRRHGMQEATRAAVGLGRMLGTTAIAFGIGLLLFPNVPLASTASPYLLLCGFFVAAAAQLDDQGTLFQSVIDGVSMRDVMLTSFIAVSPSDTLQDALDRLIHSLQDEFPVVRQDEILGVVSRGAIMASLRTEGNGYVQSVMARNLLIAAPDDTLGLTIRRMRQGRVGMIPVADAEGRVLGMVTLQNLRQSMLPLLEQRKLRAMRGNG